MRTNTERQLYRVAVIEDNQGEYNIFKKRILSHDRLEFCSELPVWRNGVSLKEYVNSIVQNCFDVDIFIIDWELKDEYAWTVLNYLRQSFRFSMTSRFWVSCSKNDGDDWMNDSIQSFFGHTDNYIIKGKDLLKGDYSIPKKLSLDSNLPWTTKKQDHFNETMDLAIRYLRNIDSVGLYDDINFSGSYIEHFEKDDSFYNLEGDGVDKIPSLKMDSEQFIFFTAIGRIGIFVWLTDNRRPSVCIFKTRDSLKNIKKTLSPYVSFSKRETIIYNPTYFSESEKLKDQYTSGMLSILSEIYHVQKFREISGSWWDQYGKDYSSDLNKLSQHLYRFGLLKRPLPK